MSSTATTLTPDAPSTNVVRGVNVMASAYGSVAERKEQPRSDAHVIDEMKRMGASRIRRVANPSERVRLECVQLDGLAYQYQYIDLSRSGSSVALNMAAVRQNGMALGMLHGTSSDEQAAAYRQTHRAFEFIDAPTEAQSLDFIRVHGASIAIEYDILMTEAVEQAIVHSDPATIARLFEPCAALQFAAVNKDPRAVVSIGKDVRADGVMLAALTADGLALMLVNIEETTDAERMAALRNNWRAIQYIDAPSDAEVMEVLTHASTTDNAHIAIGNIGATKLSRVACMWILKHAPTGLYVLCKRADMAALYIKTARSRMTASLARAVQDSVASSLIGTPRSSIEIQVAQADIYDASPDDDCMNASRMLASLRATPDPDAGGIKRKHTAAAEPAQTDGGVCCCRCCKRVRTEA
jgi:hypothetical protein